MSRDYVFFDMDGTLVHTDYANFKAYKESVKIVLGSLEAQKVRYDGSVRFNKKSLEVTLSGINPQDIQQIVLLKEVLFKNYLKDTFINQEVVDQFVSLSNENDIILVTNSKRKRAIETMAYHGLDRYVTKAFFGEQYCGRNKYDYALTVMNSENRLRAVFENEFFELEGLLNVGMSSINVELV